MLKHILKKKKKKKEKSHSDRPDAVYLQALRQDFYFSYKNPKTLFGSHEVFPEINC